MLTASIASTLSLSLLKACSAVVLLILVARGFVWLINMMVVAPMLPMFDPLKNIQGPDGSPLQNHLREVMEYVHIQFEVSREDTEEAFIR
ncbi:uncharacterized protein F5891DRAFT_705830 [Suillus fuscotomentosus]|uniref:Uncharacterized protein n=1 Tax=Suillus fuscotomentosus TaxID=1912939 RepID=A0AAD4DYD4_9AGAM|nr:uncharacterized protein F5891DRAFT_705830 [Suillus fuscotomentosus]KAG1894888.1 hypothetical protein F5891DRAFT_705830 [Suillus fuscotomentosus]